MNIVKELNILLPKLDSKQKEFIQNYSSEFQKIESRILSSNSFVGIDKTYLIIYIEHVSDQNTWIEFKVEHREIYITVVGFGYSMWQVVKGKGIEFNNGVREFIKSSFSSDFKKTIFYDKNGELVKEQLIWRGKPELMKVSIYGNSWQLIKKWFKNKFKKSEFRVSDVNFSAFV